ncbi:hypothetical protein HMPREF2136_04845 [Prevotella bivia DNF00650]|uniref:hypothetical protein n=1 Tax=Prevotella bivia TaxID=28125 RepID=UPI00050F464E|nr:hypothetical protein [Prevotella bivia]KGF37895.1 hypothetical protein HMPREF2136_04845 [Prevotella bivia DNF00650]
MKKELFTLFALFVSFSSYAQYATRFLGIPITGSKVDMINKIAQKGFSKTSYNGFDLEGEFNGTQVGISVVTNNNKVYRVCLQDLHYTDERNVQIRYNNLCKQFKENGKYLEVNANPIADNEDLSYEIRIHKKRYEAEFSQSLTDEEMKQLGEKHIKAIKEKYHLGALDKLEGKVRKEAIEELSKGMKDIMNNRVVWFMIDENYGKYGILMFYDNMANKASGEDL